MTRDEVLHLVVAAGIPVRLESEEDKEEIANYFRPLIELTIQRTQQQSSGSIDTNLLT